MPVKTHAVVRAAVIALSLSLAMGIASQAEAQRQPPLDLAGHWAAADVCRLIASGAISVHPPSGTFRPDQPVTRGELVRMLVGGLGHGPDASILARSPRTFRDVGIMHPDRGYIEAAAELGIARGYPDGTFMPNNRVTRAELAAFVVRALGLEPEARAFAGTLPFPDAAQIGRWATGYVGVIQGQGLVTGYDDGRYYPRATATRAQAATVVARVMERRGTAYSFLGTVRGISGETIVALQADTAAELRLTINADCFVFRNTRAAFLDDIAVGDQVFAVLDDQGRPTFLMAAWEDELGELVAVGANPAAVILRATTGSSRRVTVRPDALILRGGQTARLSDLRPGDRVYVVYDVHTKTARAIDAVQIDMLGTVASINQLLRTITIRSIDGSTRSLDVLSGAVVFLNGRTATLREVRSGDEVTATTITQGKISYLEVRRGD